MDPYVISMMLGTFAATHIFQLYAGLTTHLEDPFSEFYSVTTRARRLLWSLLTIAHGLGLG